MLDRVPTEKSLIDRVGRRSVPVIVPRARESVLSVDLSGRAWILDGGPNVPIGLSGRALATVIGLTWIVRFHLRPATGSMIFWTSSVPNVTGRAAAIGQETSTVRGSAIGPAVLTGNASAIGRILAADRTVRLSIAAATETCAFTIDHPGAAAAQRSAPRSAIAGIRRFVRGRATFKIGDGKGPTELHDGGSGATASALDGPVVTCVSLVHYGGRAIGRRSALGTTGDIGIDTVGVSGGPCRRFLR